LSNKTAQTISGIAVDISDATSVRRMVRYAEKKLGGIDILINAAAIQKPIGRLFETPSADWVKCITTNIAGTMLCCKNVLAGMMRRKKGKIINFSGGGATFPRPNFSAYATSKAAIVRFTETLAQECVEFHIDINSISPGPVYTAMFREIIKAGPSAGKDYKDALRIKDECVDTAAKTAELAVFLASDASDGISGKLISSVWDNWKNDKKLRQKGSLYTLRRIDNFKFSEKDSK